jgi:DNA-directed RNA polymerase subunit RPC12/RpoP
VIIAAAGIRLWWFYASQPKPGDIVRHRIPAACAACGKAYVSIEGNLPAVCRFCGKRELRRAVKCMNTKCGAIFPLMLDKPGPVEGGGPLCPKCGSTSYDDVPPNEISEP